VAINTAAGRRAQTQRPRYRQVLLVEDDPGLRETVRLNLERRGVTVTETETVAGALASLRAELPDLLVLDINLPDGTGWDVLEELRASRRLPPTLVTSAGRVTRQRLTEFGVVAHLPKPFPIDALIEFVMSR
jgi:DNA-binding response OmpR family regulator